MPRPRKHPARLIDRVTFRCSEALARAVQQAADRNQISPSEYARRAVMHELRADGFEAANNGDRPRVEGPAGCPAEPSAQ
jgi:hypothetical protein